MGEMRHGNQHRHVVADVTMRLMSASGPDADVAAEFHYTTRDPYAVKATFARAGHAPVVWVFARDLLVVGAARHAGVGDVQIYPSGGEVVMDLQSPEGSAQLAAPADDIRRFATQILTLVPAGEEAPLVDIDAELAALDPNIFAGGDL